MNRRGQLITLGVLAAVAVATAAVAISLPGDQTQPDKQAATTTFPTKAPTRTASPTTNDTRPTTEVPVDLIPLSGKTPRHPVNLDVPNRPEEVAAACAETIWSWDTVTDNSPADAAARCAPLATPKVQEQLRQRVAHVDATWAAWAKHNAWVKARVRVHDQYEPDVTFRRRWVDITVTQQANGTKKWVEVGDDVRLSIGLTRPGRQWRVDKVAVW